MESGVRGWPVLPVKPLCILATYHQKMAVKNHQNCRHEIGMVKILENAFGSNILDEMGVVEQRGILR